MFCVAKPDDLQSGKALGFKTVSDLEGGFAGGINGALGIVHNALNFAIVAVQAVGNLGGAATKFAGTRTLPTPVPDDNVQPHASNSQQTNPSPHGQASDIGIDPAIAGADQIQGQLFELYDLVHRYL
ncbi:hypothetical protein EPUS_05470 [Endocarpon pusillum Z07020]|uniref:Uncharacterized protein n=1 Tax=Endocarpon pusillum (strain Z07020 / HMAS-L-300199) TaxID=1263415 RepID=U1GDY0_ENDPU|nr:uncharacterized protein EPUS_05470 [Endocarpon pusillum Z07020]ERF69926.1 hypothetical protein EPUS_05470 [Endocarpon pusillum Z07020]